MMKVMMALMPCVAVADLPADDRCAQSILLNHTALPKCAGSRSYRQPTSAADCCHMCQTDPQRQCIAWTYNQHSPPNFSTCYLKHATDCDHQSTTSATSGIIGPPPTPPPTPSPFPTPADAKNVLFIVVDDMRPNIGSYNYSLAHTPNIDALAASGLRFDHAYVQYAYCSPSRNSFMSGRRPDTTRVWEFVDHFRETDVGAHWVSLPQYFKSNGYLTLGGGKLFHPASASENVGMHNNDYPESWTESFPYFDNQPSNGPHNCTNPTVKGEVTGKGSATWCSADVSKEASILSDQKIRDNCVQHLRNASALTADKASTFTNFFIGCGFHKPHVPWVVPQEFFTLLPQPRWQQYPLAADPFAPVGMPEVAWHPPADVGGMQETPAFNGTVNETRSRLYRRAYDAAVAYTDYNIGVVLSELEALGHLEDTLVVLLGDHGWQLGEHDTWAKMTNFELATHIPLVMRAPWKVGSAGKATKALVEAVDLYPTMAELAGLPPPHSQGQHLNGTSLAQLFENNVAGQSVKDAAFSQFAKTSPLSVDCKFTRNQTKLMGYSIRTADWRYTAWFAFDNTTLVPLTDGGQHDLGRELYDHRGDTGLWLDFPGENVNVVNRTEHRALVAQLHQRVLDYIQLEPVSLRT